MKKINCETLITKYPKIFRVVRHEDAEEFFRCGDGWFPLLDKVFNQIQGQVNQSRYQRAVYLLKMREIRRLYRKGALHDFAGFQWFSEQDRKMFLHNPFVYYEKPVLCPQFEVSTVKEKFDGLRIYGTGGDLFCEGVLALAESMSNGICEKCGQPGQKTMNKHVVATLCFSCETLQAKAGE